MDDKKIFNAAESEAKAVDTYPGVADSIESSDFVTRKEVDDETKELNNNPNNQGKII